MIIAAKKGEKDNLLPPPQLKIEENNTRDTQRNNFQQSYPNPRIFYMGVERKREPENLRWLRL